MKIQSVSPHAILMGGRTSYHVYDAYNFITHDQKSGDLSTLTTSLRNASSGQFDKFVKIKFKGTKSATLKTSSTTSNFILTKDPDTDPVESINVSPNAFFYVKVDSSSINDIIFYTDADGTSPLLRVFNTYTNFDYYGTGHYKTDGYSNGSYLNSVPDSMENYKPNMSYYPVIEVVRDYYNNQYGMSNIPTEFQNPIRIQCTAREPNVFGTESTFQVIVDKLRERIYLPYEDGTYAVITELPSGMPLDAGWNTKHQRLVCMYPRKLVEVDLETQAETLVWQPDEGKPDLKYLYVGTYDDYYLTVFIGCASEKQSFRGHWTKTGSSINYVTEQASGEEVFTSPPYNTKCKAALTPIADALSRHASNDIDAAYRNTVDGYALVTTYSERDTVPKKVFAVPPIMTSTVSHGTNEHGDNDCILSAYTFQLGVDTKVNLPVIRPVYMKSYTLDQISIYTEEPVVGTTLDFDTVAMKSGQNSPYSSDPRWKPTVNPLVCVYAKLYPELPDRFTEFKDEYDLPEIYAPLDLTDAALPTKPITVYSFPDDRWTYDGQFGSLPYMPLGANSEMSPMLGTPMLYGSCVINRKTGEVKARHRVFAQPLLDPVNKRVVVDDTKTPYTDSYTLIMPEGDDENSNFDIEVLTLGGKTVFRAVNYGNKVEDPEVEFDYIRATRVDRFHRTNTVDMRPVTDGVEIHCQFPAGLKVWINDQQYFGSETDDDGVLQERMIFVGNNTHTYTLEVKSPLTYDARKTVDVAFNGTIATIVIETPPIKGAVVDGLTTPVTNGKSAASVCNHHQQLLPPRTVLEYFDNPHKTVVKNLEAVLTNPTLMRERPLDFFKMDNNVMMVDNAIIPNVYERTIEDLPAARTTMEHKQMSVLVPSKKIDFVFHPRSGTISDFSTDWIYVSSPQPHKRAMNYWIHSSVPNPHKRSMNHWVAVAPPKPVLRDQNQWVYFDNLNHIAESLLLRATPVWFEKPYYTWNPEWAHHCSSNHVASVKPWRWSTIKSNLFEIPWVKTVNFDPHFALGWIARVERERVVWATEWTKRSNITSYLFASFDSIHKYQTYNFDVHGLSFTRHASIFGNLYVAHYSSNFYSIERPLDFIHPHNHYTISRPNTFTHFITRYLVEMPTRTIIESEGKHVVYENQPQGYYATEELAYQAAIDEGYDPEQVLIMTQEYYPNAWIFSIRFKRTGLCVKAVEFGYVRGG